MSSLEYVFMSTGFAVWLLASLIIATCIALALIAFCVEVSKLIREQKTWKGLRYWAGLPSPGDNEFDIAAQAMREAANQANIKGLTAEQWHQLVTGFHKEHKRLIANQPEPSE